MKLLRHIGLGLGIVLMSISADAQDIHFSQFLQAPTQINPATTGAFRGYQRVALNNRMQWLALGAPYITYGGAYDMPLMPGKRKENKAYIGLGLFAFKDAAGESKFGTLNTGLSVSAIIPLGKDSKFGVGIQGGYGQQTANISSLTFQNQWDGTSFNVDQSSGEGNTLTSFGYADFATGIFYEFNTTDQTFAEKFVTTIQLGASYYHLNEPKMRFYSQGEEQLFSKMIFHGMLRKDLKDSNLGLMPMGFYSIQGPHKQTNVGLLLRFKLREESRYTDILWQAALSFGLQHRLNEAWIPQVLLELGDYKLGLSYDVGVSDLKEAAAIGTFEISFQWINIRRGLLSNKGGGRGYRL